MPRLISLPRRVLSSVCLVPVLLSALTSLSFSQATEAVRVLPLNRFNVTRLAQEPGGFYHMPAAVADDYFDGTSSLERIRRHFRVARDVGARHLRCAFSWNGIEKSQGKYDWTFWDTLVDEAQKAGIELIPYVGYTPEWAAVKPEEFWRQRPRDPAVYADFMYRIVSRYKGRIKAWEIWNEPDNREYWQGTVAEYAELVRLAATQMRRADPSLVLILGGMSRGPGPFFRELLSTHDIGSWVDIIAMHAYPESWDEERAETIYQDWVQQMADLVARDADGADFWINEMGYADYRFRPNKASKWGISVFYDYEHSRAYQARFLFKTHVMSLASPRVSLTAWYRIDDFSPQKDRFSDDLVNHHLGLVDIRGKPKPAYHALRFFNQLFGQPSKRLSTRPKLPQNSQAIVETFHRTDGKLVIVGWLRSSHPDEIDHATGMARDRRRESVSVALPCKSVPESRFYTAEGHSVTSPAKFNDGALHNIPLTGHDVFIALLVCR